MWKHILTVVVAISLFSGITARIRPQMLSGLRKHANAIIQLVEGLERRHQYDIYPTYYPGQAILGEYEYEDYEPAIGDDVIIRKRFKGGGRPKAPRPPQPKKPQAPTKTKTTQIDLDLSPQITLNQPTNQPTTLAPDQTAPAQRFLLPGEASFNDDVFQAVGRAFKTNIKEHPDLRRELGDDFNPITYLKASPPPKVYGRLPQMPAMLSDTDDKL